MTPPKLDGFSKALTARLTRRRSLRSLAVAGPAALIAGTVVSPAARTAAQDQDNDTATTTCALSFVGEVSVGPDNGTKFAGTLTIRIKPDGAIDGGTLATDDGGRFAVVGQAVGRALNLRATVADGRWLTLTGTAADVVVACASPIDGLFCGPQRGDLGTWTALPTS
jgi:hypothetical protein